MTSVDVAAAMQLLRSGVDRLLGADLSALASSELTALVVELEVQRRRLCGVDHRVITEVGERGVAGEYARTSTPDLLVTLLRVTPGEAMARVAQAGDLGPRRAVDGERLAPLLPHAAAAIRGGAISSTHAAVISRCLERIPSNIAYEAAPVAEAMLVEAARHQHPRALAQTAAVLLGRLDPDGAEPREREVERRREFALIKNADGSSRPSGLFTAEVTALWETILDSLAAPVSAEDGMADDRSPRQRRHDAMGEAASRLLRSATLPASGGVPVTVLARTTLAELEAGTGDARTGHGDTWSMRQLILSACEADIVPVVSTEAGAALALGRARRLASRAQRMALTVRDGGCCFPACDRPAAWTEVHHVRPWADGGRTDVDNMCLLCRYHHREFEARGWTVRMREGVPEWLPPPFIDPQRRPIRNHTHHPPDIDLAKTVAATA